MFYVAVFTRRCLVAASNGGRSPYSRFPNYPRASATRFSLLTACCGSWSSLSIASARSARRTPLPAALLFYVRVAPITWHITSRRLAMGVFTEPFPNNSCLCWLHNSGFHQTCHNIFTYTPLHVMKYLFIFPINGDQSKYIILNFIAVNLGLFYRPYNYKTQLEWI
jgi:hypothetical protein